MGWRQQWISTNVNRRRICLRPRHLPKWRVETWAVPGVCSPQTSWIWKDRMRPKKNMSIHYIVNLCISLQNSDDFDDLVVDENQRRKWSRRSLCAVPAGHDRKYLKNILAHSCHMQICHIGIIYTYINIDRYR